ncbi:hypothetical protein ABZ318_26400 [Streptomyces sp. NPDC006197]
MTSRSSIRDESLRLDGVTYVPLSETETVDLVMGRRTDRGTAAA